MGPWNPSWYGIWSYILTWSWDGLHDARARHSGVTVIFNAKGWDKTLQKCPDGYHWIYISAFAPDRKVLIVSVFSGSWKAAWRRFPYCSFVRLLQGPPLSLCVWTIIESRCPSSWFSRGPYMSPTSLIRKVGEFIQLAFCTLLSNCQWKLGKMIHCSYLCPGYTLIGVQELHSTTDQCILSACHSALFVDIEGLEFSSI